VAHKTPTNTGNMGLNGVAHAVQNIDAMSRYVLLAVLLALPSMGCSHVASYDRGLLAHPSMTVADLEGPAAGHVRSVHEGATGGGSVAESGCGCN
jgi:Domain of unknown function (DUF4266)